MNLLARLRSVLSALLRRRRFEREMEQEWQSHLELRAEALMAEGQPRSDAERRARREFGDPLRWKEQGREARGLGAIQDLGADVRYALRQIRRAPAFAMVAIATLALAIGANTAIFSVINGLLLRPLPVLDPQRLVTLSSSGMIADGTTPAWTYATWEQIRQRSQSFDGTLAWSGGGAQRRRFNLAQGGEMELVDGLYVSGDFFTTLGVPALLGRTLTAADDVRGGGADGPVAVISYGLWQRRFGGAADIVGRTLAIERVPVTIVGVTPPEFFGAEVGRAFEVALPIGCVPLIQGNDRWLGAGGPAFLTVMLRLKPGQSSDSANATLHDLQTRIADAAMPGDCAACRQQFLNDPMALVPAAGGTSALRQQYQRPLFTILIVVVLVLLIACANLANLLLARAGARQHELRVRRAIGASRWRLARQLLVESLILAQGGALFGLIVAAWGSRALVAQLSTSVAHVALDLPMDWRVLAFAMAVTGAAAMLFGTLPALRATRVDIVDVMKGSAPPRGTSDVPAAARLGANSSGALLVAQVALSLVLVVGAGLFVRTFGLLASVPLGFDSARVLVANVNATRVRLDPADRTAFYQRLAGAIAVVPGVAHVAASNVTPLGGGAAMMGFVSPRGTTVPQREQRVAISFVTPGWFATYGTTIHGGRDINERDTREALPVVVVNDAFVRRFFPTGNALGAVVMPARPPSGRPPIGWTIVGIVDDAVSMSLRSNVSPTMYEPLAQWDWGVPPTEISLSVRASTDSPAVLARGVAAALVAVDRDLAFAFRPLADQVRASLIQERLLAVLSGFFGALALGLAALGVYGVTAYGVSRRRAEIGIRMALGAERRGIVTLMLSRVSWLVVTGVIVGVATSVILSRFVAALLYGIQPYDPLTMTGAAVALAAIAMLAAWYPALRASRIDPAQILRSN